MPYAILFAARTELLAVDYRNVLLNNHLIRSRFDRHWPTQGMIESEDTINDQTGERG